MIRDLSEVFALNKQIVYRDFFSRNCKSADSWLRKHAGLVVRVGKSSFGFDVTGVARGEEWRFVRDLFGLSDVDDDGNSNEIKFRQSIGGLERNRVFQLNSSSLLPFLCFHSVCEHNPIVIDAGCEKLRFTRVRFEVKNTLPEMGTTYAQSHVDVVLEGSEDVLFLESKFFEYVRDCGKGSVNVSGLKYRPFLIPLFGEKLNKRICMADDELLCDDEGRLLKLRFSSGRPHYLQGIVQMLWHYYGIQGTICKDVDVGDRRLHLAEILFDFKCASSSARLEDYRLLHGHLEPLLRKVGCGRRVVDIVPRILTYQDDLTVRMPDAVRGFYML